MGIGSYNLALTKIGKFLDKYKKKRRKNAHVVKGIQSKSGYVLNKLIILISLCPKSANCAPSGMPGTVRKLKVLTC